MNFLKKLERLVITTLNCIVGCILMFIVLSIDSYENLTIPMIVMFLCMGWLCVFAKGLFEY